MSVPHAIVRWVDRSLVQPCNNGLLVPAPLMLLAGFAVDRNFPVKATFWTLAALWVAFVFWRLAIYMRAAKRFKPGSTEAQRFIREYGND